MPALAASRARPGVASSECLVRQRPVCRLTQRTRGRREAVWLDIQHRRDLCYRTASVIEASHGRKAALFVTRALSRVAAASATSCLRFSISRCGASSASSLMASRIAP